MFFKARTNFISSLYLLLFHGFVCDIGYGPFISAFIFQNDVTSLMSMCSGSREETFKRLKSVFDGWDKI